MASPVIRPCSCTGVTTITVKSAASKFKPTVTNIPFHTRQAGAEFQDQKYGIHNRLHNPQVKDGKTNGFTCTVCGNRKGL